MQQPIESQSSSGSTLKPLVEVGEFASLKVVSVEEVGNFLDWGLPKNLLLPFGEQTRSLRPGDRVLVHVYRDQADRPVASMRLDRHLDKSPASYEEGQKVDLIIGGETDLGYKAIINHKHWGLLYSDEVFQLLHTGQKIVGYIRKLRPDGKIDLILQPAGHQATGEIGTRILELLQQKGGFLPINDKTPAEEIYERFGVSKKKYKIALGGLYKQRLLKVDHDGIRLVSK